ncbi:DUF3718 domain-containing protein [Pseudoalteromonas denitrificans]|uniref:DUF3718 domain-containing protein n=1 Tax=Pseudoalteromonas denitrificans DSM 6059 TaxID=1123010 RepID=A0A1I1G8E6_9GAMM|nr:DUF3718 domain-containing protein [Pseudoalteromonas denitrificans]SFC07967.1 Protein of unknown function [Pseudoalteromonas denitrificans DSM 6059]
MKKVLILTSLLAVAALNVPTASADDISLRVCEYISVNDKTRLRSFLKNKKLKVRNIFKKIECNGKNLLIFAATKQSLDTGEFLIGKLPKKVVSANLAEITKLSAHLAEDAKERVE